MTVTAPGAKDAAKCVPHLAIYGCEGWVRTYPPQLPPPALPLRRTKNTEESEEIASLDATLLLIPLVSHTRFGQGYLGLRGFGAKLLG